MSNIIFLSNVRLSFRDIYEPKREEREDGSVGREIYSAEFIIPKDHKGYSDFLEKAHELATEVWKDKTTSVMKIIHADRKTRCFGSGDDKVSQKTFEIYDGYEGNNYLTARKFINPPQLIKPDGSPVNPLNTMEYKEVAKTLYPGCYVNVAVQPWIQVAGKLKNGQTKPNAIRCELIAVQFFKDGERFGQGAPDVSNLFGKVDGDQFTDSLPDFLAA